MAKKKTVTITLDAKQATIVSMALADRAKTYEKLTASLSNEKLDVAAKAVSADLRELNKVQAQIDRIVPRDEEVEDEAAGGDEDER